MPRDTSTREIAEIMTMILPIIPKGSFGKENCIVINVSPMDFFSIKIKSISISANPETRNIPGINVFIYFPKVNDTISPYKSRG
jgi:hypothetical protein